MSHDPIAFTYEADVHCPSCTFERFGREVRDSRCETCGEPGNTVPFSMANQHHRWGPRDHDFKPQVISTHPWPPESAKDREGNPIGAIAPWDDWCVACQDTEPDPSLHGLWCGTCREPIRDCAVRDRAH